VAMGPFLHQQLARARIEDFLREAERHRAASRVTDDSREALSPTRLLSRSRWRTPQLRHTAGCPGES
jgi:hypothetical protein